MQIFLTTPESRLRVRDGLFEVSYYDKDGRLEKAQHAPALLDSIWLHDGSTITIAAVRLAMQNNIDIVVCDRHGMPEGRFLGFRPSTTSFVQKAQAMAAMTPLGLTYGRDWAAQKLEAQANYLERLGRRRTEEQRQALAEPIRQIREALAQMQAIDIPPDHPPNAPDIPARIRGLEGSASRAFFQSLGKLIPEQYAFQTRSRRPALDAFNAYLNYAYAILYRKIERALNAAGLNAYIGFLHRDGYQFKSLVYDFIEPFRVETVQAVFSLFAKQSVKLDVHAQERPGGGVQLTREGKGLLLGKLNRFYDKNVEYDGLSMSRDRVIEKTARRFALSLVANMRRLLAAANEAFAPEEEELILESE